MAITTDTATDAILTLAETHVIPKSADLAEAFMIHPTPQFAFDKEIEGTFAGLSIFAF